MLPCKIKITGADIAYAEGVLLGEGESFEDEKDERKKFIRNLETIDLQAVPGSGKTTVLLAKLLILERYLPFRDGSGILVISHTNTAVDEIKNRLAKHCPKLFAYPNFVGTIQRFVDVFLATPFAWSYLNSRLPYIDTEIYQGELWKSFQGIYWDENSGSPGKWFWRRHIQQAKAQAVRDDETQEICKRAIEREVKDLYFDFRDEKIKRASDGSVVLATQGNVKYDAIGRIIKGVVLEQGIISYEYAYHFGRVYLEKAPLVKALLQKRFRYMFVDEMQDMDRHQYDLLEEIFYDDGGSCSIYQRVGDKNQAIFSHEVKLEEIWCYRKNNTLQLTGSHRLSPSIAGVVAPFGVPATPIDGWNTVNDELSPHVIVFGDDSVEKAIPKFCELVKKYVDEGRIPKDRRYSIKAIAWRKGEDGKFGLKNYWRDFEAKVTRSRLDYPNLKSYLLLRDSDGTDLNGICRNITNALVKVLRLEQVTDPERNGRYFSRRGFQRHLRENHPEFYRDLRLKIFRWSRDVYMGKIESVYCDMKSFVPRLLSMFEKDLSGASDFVNDEVSREGHGMEDSGENSRIKDNVYRCEKTGVQVRVGTVHSVKGETHTATLYLESYYEKDGRGQNAKSYESQRLKDQFERKEMGSGAGKRTRQSARMVYVGFSRPTHLLCFAVHRDRFDEKLFRNKGWEIVRIC